MLHPNKVEFRGLLAKVDEVSNRAPDGARGHLVSVPLYVAERSLESLVGMALSFAPELNKHDKQRKVGVITEAEVTERDLLIGGYIYARDFPEVVKLIPKSGQIQASEDQLGLSYEITNVEIKDMRSRIWELTKIVFTGAAILKREKAAYKSTWIELL